MNTEEIREYCLAKPGATEDFPFNDKALVFKVMNKMFVLLDLSDESRGISLKCDPELAIELREQHPEVTPAWHFNKVLIIKFYLYEVYAFWLYVILKYKFILSLFFANLSKK
jgi:predicted DNA-binding protein (MmcQ/YjbR family)